MSISSIVAGSALGGGLSALAMGTYYGSSAVAAAFLGPLYPTYVIGGSIIGSVAAHKYSHKQGH